MIPAEELGYMMECQSILKPKLDGSIGIVVALHRFTAVHLSHVIDVEPGSNDIRMAGLRDS